MRVATATHQPPIAVWRAPYRRTLYEFFHLEQADHFADLRRRDGDLHRAGLFAMAFHEPKRLDGEYRKLLTELRPPIAMPTPDDARAFLDQIMTLDRAGAWKEVVQ